jgi:hypothetical protein
VQLRLGAELSEFVTITQVLIQLFVVTGGGGGAGSITRFITAAARSPVESVTVTIGLYVPATVGMPESTPLDESESPGMAGDRVQVSG